MKKWFKRMSAFAVVVCALVWCTWLLLPFPQEILEHPRQSTLLTDRHGEPLRIILASDSTYHLWVEYEDFGEWLPQAMVSAEDKRFWRHGGYDWRALARASFQNVRNLRRVSGASTLSTQVIRLAVPRRRTFLTKVREFFRATQMERHLSKREIMEHYLNRAPFGGNLVGAEAASQRYFGKSARDLSLAEAALLAGLPQGPTRHRPDRNPESAERRRAYVLRRMRLNGVITPEQEALALRVPLPATFAPYPSGAPHFCDELGARLPASGLGGIVRATLDMTVQREAEEALGERLKLLPDVNSGAIVVLDTGSAEVLAMVGSPDVSDASGAGQFNHAMAWRSPGSALKPFVYGLALDQGRISPATALADTPRHFAGYEPGNFDGGFHGMVSAHDALVRSLNIPVLGLVQECGADVFHALLDRLGIEAFAPRSVANLGIGAALGNTETRLLDLTSAYASLGRAGRVLAPRMLPNEWVVGAADKRVEGGADAGAETAAAAGGVLGLSAEAAWIVLDMLSGEERVAQISGHYADVARPRVAWKTGTSSGFRDAWTVAVTPRYTIGVWLGNSDGASAAGLIGVEAAAPAAFGLLSRISGGADDAGWFERPPAVRRVAVCAASGAMPLDICPRSMTTWQIAGVTRPKACAVHRVVERDGVALVEEVWPAEAALALRGNQAARAEAGPPQILSPAPNEVFRRMTDASPHDNRLVMRARGSSTLHWFLNGGYLGAVADGAPLPWELREGRHELLCADADGRAASLWFTVE